VGTWTPPPPPNRAETFRRRYSVRLSVANRYGPLHLERRGGVGVDPFQDDGPGLAQDFEPFRPPPPTGAHGEGPCRKDLALPDFSDDIRRGPLARDHVDPD